MALLFNNVFGFSDFTITIIGIEIIYFVLDDIEIIIILKKF